VRRVVVAGLVVSLLLATPVGSHGGTGQEQAALDHPRIVECYPNPVPDGDPGEYVVLSVPDGTRLDTLTLSDGETTVSLPNRTASGRVVVTTNGSLARNRTNGTILDTEAHLQLSNAGERIVLRRDNRTVETVEYDDAPEGEVAHATATGIEWRPLGATTFDPVRAGSGRVRAFVLPDAAGQVTRVLGSAENRILLEGYTLTSDRVADELLAAARRGVDVRVLVEGGPVGGLTREQARVLDRLAAANVTVAVVAGDAARYTYQHAKFAVVDDRAMVLTENWKPAGTGGRSSRGWGVVVSQPRAVASLARTFRADAGGRDVRRWTAFRRGQSFEPGTPANGTYPSQFEPQTVRASGVTVLHAPDNAESAVLALLANATESIRVVQVSIGSPRQPFLQAAIQAARRGVDVQILLSSAWYVREENRDLVARLNERAAREDLPLEASLAQPHNRFEKIHAKAVIVDDRRVLVGSLNWNNHSARANREVAVVLDGQAVAQYYGRVFRTDWQGENWHVTVGCLLAVVVVALLALLRARTIRFEPQESHSDYRKS
jgi:phosphatidylserine/phosphatidylglycerophosphate/cardiolipin synthase-like enzyme